MTPATERMPIEAVLFDLDDTLHDDTDAYRRAAAAVAADVALRRGVDAAMLEDAYIAEAEAFWSTLSSATLGTPLVGLRASMWQRALKRVGIDDTAFAAQCAANYNHRRSAFLRLFPGARELLVALRSHGCKLAMITNGFSETHRDKIALLDLDYAFDEIVIADEVGMVKPEPRIFLYACARLGVEPAAAAMVGDRYERDVRAAGELGLFTVWMNVRSETLAPGLPPADVTVHTIAEMSAALIPRLARA